MSASRMVLSPWLREMLSQHVLTEREAAEIQLVQESQESGWVTLPRHLQPAARRVSLFETPAANVLPL